MQIESRPKVSIIVPVYKVEKYIDKCIQSILSQTLREIEVILVDDGSPDKCPLICDNYAKYDSRIKVIHQKNSRQGASRNNGMKIAMGEYIAFVDSDDFISNDMVEKLYFAASKNDCDIVMCDYQRFSNSDDLQYNGKSKIDKVFLEKQVFNLDDLSEAPHRKSFFLMAVSWNKIFKKEFAIENIVFPENMIFEDAFPMFRVFARAKKISIVNEKLYFYRTSNKNSSSLSSDNRVFDLFKSVNMILDDMFIYDYQYLTPFIVNSVIRDLIHHIKRLDKHLKKDYNMQLKFIINRMDEQNLCQYIAIKDKIRLWFLFNTGSFISNIVVKI